MYSEYINSDDFVYDESNPYVVELYYHITSFMQIRERLEYNGSNIGSLISKFQKMCNKTLKKYWDDTTYDYYGRMKEIFKYDFYTKGDNLTEANIHDIEKETLYKKVLNYLKTLTRYTAPRSNEEKYKDTNINNLINGTEIPDTSQEKKMRELEEKLKKIAISFVQLKRIESEIDQNYFSEYIPEEDTEDIFTLKDQLGLLSLQNYAATYTALMAAPPTPETATALAAVIAEIQKYVDPLLRLTRNESRILRELSDKAINWYIDNDKDISDGTAFDKFQEAVWSGKSVIYKDNEPYDFYFVEQPLNVSEKLKLDVLNGGNEEEGIMLKHILRSKFPNAKIRNAGQVAPSLAIHTGPGALGVAVFKVSEKN
jgi:hypothetical protein